IRHGVEGLLFEPGNAQDLADALDVMAENPAQAHEMGLKGRVRLCQKYSLRKHMETLQSLYRELLDRP
ncbi:MAG: glycosyltransferase family 1 protein, partial [Leclercia adecarboxylata]|nr:glycosyltransferase family 1 protein [Leclercia adecarboxylata]